MVSFSKLLDSGLREAKCQDVFHPGQSCVQFFLGNVPNNLVTSMKYFPPIVGMPLLLKGKNLKKQHLMAGLWYYVETFLTGFAIAQSAPIALCGSRAIFGRYNKFNFLCLPGILSTLSMLFTSARVARLFAASIFQMTLETSLLRGRNPITRIIAQSKRLQTIIFMMCSAFIMNAIQRKNLSTFWFITTVPSPRPEQADKCTHNNTCSRSLLKELPKVLLIGTVLDLFKTLLEALAEKKRFLDVLTKHLKQLNFPTALFLSSYTSIYRLTLCLLTHHWKTDTVHRHLVASFLGGLSFRFICKLSVLCYAISVCVEMSWKLFEAHKDDDSSVLLEKIKKIPFHRILTVFPVGYLLYIYVFHSKLLSPLASTVLKVFTGNLAPVLRRNVHRYLKTLE